jgi:hypothetical protein
MNRTQTERDSEDDSDFHRREWKVERVGWAAMAVVVALALGGVFGRGPLSQATTGQTPQATISYQRFARYGSSTSLQVTPAEAQSKGDLHIEVDGAFIDANRIESLTPAPIEMRTAADRHVFTFSIEGAQTITFRLKPDRIGSNAGAFLVGSSPPLYVHQYVYP